MSTISVAVVIKWSVVDLCLIHVGAFEVQLLETDNLSWEVLFYFKGPRRRDEDLICQSSEGTQSERWIEV